MSNSTKSMQQIRQIIQLNYQKTGIRQIARLSGMSRVTVRHYLRRWEALQLTPAQLSALDDGALGALMYQETVAAPDDRLADLLARIPRFIRELGRTGVTRQLLWEEYRRAQPNGYGYTQFCEHLLQGSQKSDAVMHFEHKAGEKMMVDFAGKQLSYVDLETGELIGCQVFVATLPYSGYCYVEATRTQNRADFLGALANALAWFGGVPACGVSDNLKSAVKSPDRYEPQFNDLLEQLTLHYKFAFMAARPGKPRDKASVERHVLIVYQRVYAPLRDQIFHSITDINTAIKAQMMAHHAMGFQNRAGNTRQHLFETVERPLLAPLPDSPFEVKYTASYKVQRNYHVQLGCDRHFYSVPYAHIGVQATVVYTRDHVEIYVNKARVALHKRNTAQYGYTTLAAHMPPNHAHYAIQKGYSAQYFGEQADRIGVACRAVVTHILAAKAFQEQTYNSCLGLIRLATKYTPQRLELACSRALKTTKPTFPIVQNILQNNTDQLELPFGEQPEPLSSTPRAHPNIRGAQAFQ